MPDWNKDGKNDFHDDYVFNEILNGKKSNVQSSGNGSGCTTEVGCTTIVLLFALMLLKAILEAVC